MIPKALRKRIRKCAPLLAVLSREACFRVGHEIVELDARVIGNPEISGNFVTVFSNSGTVAVYELPCTG